MFIYKNLFNLIFLSLYILKIINIPIYIGLLFGIFILSNNSNILINLKLLFVANIPFIITLCYCYIFYYIFNKIIWNK